MITYDIKMLNPPIITDIYDGFTIIRDDLLPGGTKQRAILDTLAILDKPGFVYAGPYNGYAQAAISIGCKILGLRACIFIPKHVPRTKPTKTAMDNGAEIFEIQGAKLKNLQELAEDFARVSSLYYLPFGLDSDIFYCHLVKSIREASPEYFTSFTGTVWVVIGSGTLIKVLYNIFPHATFGAVQVGKKVWPDQINDRTTLYIAPEFFYNDATHLPPYPSVSTYDAKVWYFAKEYGKAGDIIWNVGS